MITVGDDKLQTIQKKNTHFALQEYRSALKSVQVLISYPNQRRNFSRESFFLNAEENKKKILSSNSNQEKLKLTRKQVKQNGRNICKLFLLSVRNI